MNGIDELTANLRRYYTSLGLQNVDSYVKRRLERDRSKQIVSFIAKKSNVNFGTASVLDIGSGWGEFLLTLKEIGTSEICGVEPDPELVAISNLLMGAETARQGMAEALPFNSGSFDLVICHDVIEHVMHCDIALAEMIRVTKVGGTIWLEFPNYAYPQESHYKTFFPPYLPKSLGALYLRLIGRDPSFYRDNVHPIFYRQVMKTINLFNVTWVDVHNDFHGIEHVKSFKATLKRWYTLFSGPPVSSLLINKTDVGLKTACIEFVKGNPT
ncbi:MAG: methyltransferase domain-containing protein [Geobacter sp.]|nr:methyltransferase domain-containing protein [Geobacter sp.]